MLQKKGKNVEIFPHHFKSLITAKFFKKRQLSHILSDVDLVYNHTFILRDMPSISYSPTEIDKCIMLSPELFSLCIFSLIRSHCQISNTFIPATFPLFSTPNKIGTEIPET